MLRRLAIAISFMTALNSDAQVTIPRADASLRMPPGTRTNDKGHMVSSRGLRDTTEFFANQLERLGIATHQIGPYRVGGAELTRFISQTPPTPWLAIHVLRVAGKTLIFVVPRPPLDERRPRQ